MIPGYIPASIPGCLEVDGALIFVTAFDIFSIDAPTCRENWCTHEDYVPAPRPRRSIAVRRIWMNCFPRGPSMPASSPTISRPANASGKP